MTDTFLQNRDISATIALSPIDDQLIFYEILPNEKKIKAIAFEDKETEAFNINVEELQTEVHKWSPSGDEFEPFREEITWLQSFQNVQYRCDESDSCISTAYILRVLNPPEKGGYNPLLYTSLVLIQHYSSFGERHRSSQRCVMDITRAYRNYDYDRGEEIPLVDVTFNHAAWVEKNKRTRIREVKLATFPVRNYDGSDSGSITEAHIVTLEIPDSLKDSLIPESINKMILNVIIDEVQGAIILICSLNRVFTLYYS